MPALKRKLARTLRSIVNRKLGNTNHSTLVKRTQYNASQWKTRIAPNNTHRPILFLPESPPSRIAPCEDGSVVYHHFHCVRGFEARYPIYYISYQSQLLSVSNCSSERTNNYIFAVISQKHIFERRVKIKVWKDIASSTKDMRMSKIDTIYALGAYKLSAFLQSGT